MRDEPAKNSGLTPELLQELEQWTSLAGWGRIHLRSIQKYWRALGEPKPFRVIDMGCGLGGVLLEISKWADEIGIPTILVGVETDEAVVEAAASRLGNRARIIHRTAFPSVGGPPQAFDLGIATLLVHQLSMGDRFRLVAELTRLAETAYIFDVTTSVEGDVGLRLAPLLGSLGAAPPQTWLQSLKKAPTMDDMVRLVGPLPVEVVRVFPAAVCTQPEPMKRVKVDSTKNAPVAVRFDAPSPAPGTVPSERRGD